MSIDKSGELPEDLSDDVERLEGELEVRPELIGALVNAERDLLLPERQSLATEAAQRAVFYFGNLNYIGGLPREAQKQVIIEAHLLQQAAAEVGNTFAFVLTLNEEAATAIGRKPGNLRLRKFKKITDPKLLQVEAMRKVELPEPRLGDGRYMMPVSKFAHTLRLDCPLHVVNVYNGEVVYSVYHAPLNTSGALAERMFPSRHRQERRVGEGIGRSLPR